MNILKSHLLCIMYTRYVCGYGVTLAGWVSLAMLKNFFHFLVLLFFELLFLEGSCGSEKGIRPFCTINYLHIP